jgi:hypothetical protein
MGFITYFGPGKAVFITGNLTEGNFRNRFREGEEASLGKGGRICRGSAGIFFNPPGEGYFVTTKMAFKARRFGQKAILSLFPK